MEFVGQAIEKLNRRIFSIFASLDVAVTKHSYKLMFEVLNTGQSFHDELYLA